MCSPEERKITDRYRVVPQMGKRIFRNTEAALGMSVGTAAGILRKALLFEYVKKQKNNFCFQCKEEIVNIDEFSIEHKIPWRGAKNAKRLFFDLDNIAFSHLGCNSAASRKQIAKCGSVTKYVKENCRCKLCTKANTIQARKYRQKRKKTLLAQPGRALVLHTK